MFNLTTAVFWYHQICRAKRNTNTTFTCFRDLKYLCICEPDHSRAECFGYNPLTDHCSLCLSNGYCLKGEVNDKTDFVCLCPRCHHGAICQYSTEGPPPQKPISAQVHAIKVKFSAFGGTSERKLW